MSITFAAVICDADDPCSVNTAHDHENIFYNVTSEYDPALKFLILRFQLRILEDDKDSINDEKWTFLPLFLASSVTSFLFLTFVSCHMPGFSPVFPIIFPLPPVLLEFFIAWGIGMNLCTKICTDLKEWVSFPAVWWSWWGFCVQLLPAFGSLIAFVGTNNTSVFCLAFLQYCGASFTSCSVSHRSFSRHRCWHRNLPTFYERLSFMISLTSFVVWFDEVRVFLVNLSGTVEFWFLDSTIFVLLLLFSFFRHVLPHIWPYSVWSWGRLFPRESLTRPCFSVRWPSHLN